MQKLLLNSKDSSLNSESFLQNKIFLPNSKFSFGLFKSSNSHKEKPTQLTKILKIQSCTTPLPTHGLALEVALSVQLSSLLQILPTSDFWFFGHFSDFSRSRRVHVVAISEIKTNRKALSGLSSA